MALVLARLGQHAHLSGEEDLAWEEGRAPSLGVPEGTRAMVVSECRRWLLTPGAGASFGNVLPLPLGTDLSFKNMWGWGGVLERWLSG